jgi:hypothetical protein
MVFPLKVVFVPLPPPHPAVSKTASERTNGGAKWENRERR